MKPPLNKIANAAQVWLRVFRISWLLNVQIFRPSTRPLGAFNALGRFLLWPRRRGVSPIENNEQLMSVAD